MSRIGGETNLIVYDDVYSSMSGVSWQIRQVHRFKNNTLSTEGSISMEKNRHNLKRKKYIISVSKQQISRSYFLSFSVSPVKLFCFRFTLDNRVYSFQMGWISTNCQANIFVRYSVQSRMEIFIV